MPRIVRLQQGDGTLRFFLGNLAEDVFGKMMLELGEGGHAVIDPIEQDQNNQPGESPEAKTDKKAFTRPGRTEIGVVAFAMIET